MMAIRPRGDNASSPETRNVGQCGRHRPHPTHVLRSSSNDTTSGYSVYCSAMALDHLAAVEHMTEAIRSRVEVDPNLDVPDCPGWNARRLLAHMGSVHAMMSNLVGTRATSFGPPRPDQKAPAEGSLSDWFGVRLTEVLGVLRERPVSDPQWSWTADHTVGFYHRRLLFESAVHLADIQRARGEAPAIDREIAVAGIDEFFQLMLPASTKPKPVGSLHLHCTDGDGEWLVRNVDDVIVTTHEHAKGDAAWRGPASALFLYAWGRRSDSVEVLGDQAVSAAWASAAP
ncbi:MAG: hypothetical protein B7C54_08715 [Acidimicrobiales bacterium mtb01]|nr:maleylpyruvate isomerase family mycothiol-dependent enzyme [Actinomycetota bacterium]TEX45955.1 MAG: hypothetical protein B7C54_08715 [Acidimicrobiales bacterium mtb01]